MKSKIFFVLFLAFSLTKAFAQKSATIKVTHFPGNTLVNGQSKFVAPNYIRVSTTNLNCFPFLDVAVYVKASGDKDKPYRYKVGITNNSPFVVNVTCSKWGFGNGGRSGIKSGATYSPSGNLSDERGLSITISDVDFDFSENEQQRYGVSTLSEKLNCNETPNSYLAKIQAKNKKKEKIKKLQEEIRSLGNREAELTHKLALLKDLKDLDTNSNYDSRISAVEEKLERIKEERTQKNEEISALKEQINTLGNSKEDLEEKKQLYKKLDTIDEENNYDNEISKIEEEIETINKEEKEVEEKKKQGKDSEKEKNKEDTNEESLESEEEKAEKLKEEEAEKERNKVREKQEAEERERERQARIQEKVKDYKNKVKDANKRNQQLASASAASSASFLYVVGGFIYSNMGSNSGDIYGEGFNNFHFGLDFGYSLNTTPLVFNSNMEDIDESTGNVFNVEKFIPSQSITVDLGLKMLMAAEGQNYRAEGYVGIKGGFSPIFDSFRSDLYYGFEANGGVSWIKAVLGLEWGNKSYSKSNILDSQEIGNAKSSFGSKKLKYGLKFSWYGNTDYARHHLSFGLIKEQIISLGDNIYIEDLDDNLRAGSSWIGESSLETYNDKYADLSTYTGYFLKWVHDHHSTLTIEVYPKYPRTGEITVNQFDPDDFSNQGSLFFNIGFTRNLDWFTFKK